MKKLSIEEKAKRYDEALHKAKSVIEQNPLMEYLKKGIEYIFPELKESEDERIMKEIIATIHLYYGEPLEDEAKEMIAWLEKQGEKKETLCDKCKKAQPSHSCQDITALGRCALEKQGEPKPADVRTTGYWHVEDASEGRWFGNGIKAHLWTIKDAKDGDVLIDKSGSRECPFIFKETKPSDIKTDMLNPLAVLGYCGIGGAGFTKGSGWGDTANCIYYPATKEQREQLEKAMADAGYTFDFEKKELKKIEQTSANETPYPETLEKAIDLYYNSYGNGEGEFEHFSLEKFRDIVHTFVSDYGQKPAWSEEDYNQIETIACHLDNTDNEGMAEVLRNIRDKYCHTIPQSHWKPSDKQIIELRRVISGCSYDIEPLAEMEEQLKKLREE